MSLYEPINGWTKSQIIEALKRGNNGTRSVEEGADELNFQCLYRGPGGNKCGVGVFIPDDVYDQKIETLSAGSVLQNFPGLKDFMPLIASGMDRLQEVHDRCQHGKDPRPLMIQWVEVNVKETNDDRA